MAASSELHFASDEKRKRSTINVFFVSLFAISSVMILYTLLLFSLPIFASGSPLEVQSRAVFVSKFNLSDWKVSANLNTQFSFHNPNKAFNVKIKSIEGTIYYKYIEPLAAATISDSFKLKADELEFARLKFSSIGFNGEPALIRSEVIEDILKDLGNGVVQFSEKMRIISKYESGPIFWNSVLTMMCEGLNVEFNNKMGSGRLMEPAAKNCSVIEFRHIFH
ncbi:hypothetical protein REPUB_Repub06bG0149100 [Reevesia pubescens]